MQSSRSRIARWGVVALAPVIAGSLVWAAGTKSGNAPAQKPATCPMAAKHHPGAHMTAAKAGAKDGKAAHKCSTNCTMDPATCPMAKRNGGCPMMHGKGKAAAKAGKAGAGHKAATPATCPAMHGKH